MWASVNNRPLALPSASWAISLRAPPSSSPSAALGSVGTATRPSRDLSPSFSFGPVSHSLGQVRLLCAFSRAFSFQAPSLIGFGPAAATIAILRRVASAAGGALAAADTWTPTRRQGTRSPRSERPTRPGGRITDASGPDEHG